MYPRDSIILCDWRLEKQDHLQIVFWFWGEMAGFQRVRSEITVFFIKAEQKK